MADNGDIADVIKGLRALKRLIDGEPEGIDVRMVAQDLSILGPRVHIAAAKRRIAKARAEGVPSLHYGAATDGKRLYYLTQESIAEELGNLEAKGAAKALKRKVEREQQQAEIDATPVYNDALAAMRAAMRGAR